MSGILIYGSCVSRDAFELSGAPEFYDYFARSSVTSSMAESKSGFEDVDLSRNPSAFQRRIVDADLNGGLVASLSDRKPGLLLVDFIDERFDTALAATGNRFTISTELMVAGVPIDGLERLKFGEERYFELFANGWRRLTQLVDPSRIVVNKVYWAEADATGTRLPAIDSIQQANANLDRIYDLVLEISPSVRWIEYPQEVFVADPQHKWGLSPFHYVERFYEIQVDQLNKLSGATRPTLTLSSKEITETRNIERLTELSVGGDSNYLTLTEEHLDPTDVIVDNGVDKPQGDSGRITINCRGLVEKGGFNGDQVRQVRIKTEKVRRFEANGFGITVRLTGWEEVHYIAFGPEKAGEFHHVKAVHPLLDDWFDLCFSFNDLAWGWSNGWVQQDAVLPENLKFFIKGRFGSNPTIEIACVRLWLEKPLDLDRLVDRAVVSDTVIENLLEYQKLTFPEYRQQGKSQLESESCALTGDVVLPWASNDHLPQRLGELGTFEYSWHALHPAVIALLYGTESRDPRSSTFALLTLEAWYLGFYRKPNVNQKFVWYDHGTAERLLAFVSVYGLLSDRLPYRWKKRLASLIYDHAQLLASEVFYAGHQASRYHNHAWFQDFALLAVSSAFPQWAASSVWSKIALARLNDQFSRLISRENGFAVFAENSVGYHLGVGRMVDRIAEFATDLAGGEAIQSLASELERFSRGIRYPDMKRTIANGDTFRVANVESGDPAGKIAYTETEEVLLRHSGYAWLKANIRDMPFMLVAIATGLSKTHKHADNCSFTLYADGFEWLIDPSFYSHDYTAPLPSYLRGASAHNSFTIPEATYDIDPGLATLSGESTDRSFIIEMAHEAIKDWVFERRIEASRSSLHLSITDRATGDGSGSGVSPKLFLHFGEGVDAKLSDSTVTLSHSASKLSLEIAFPTDAQIKLVKGSDHTFGPGGLAGTGLECVTEITTAIVSPSSETIQNFQWSVTGVVS